jgi:GPI biosynthesis protein family Pig-F
MATSSSLSPLTKSALKPITTFNNALAQAFTNVHPILLLAFYSLRFNSLTEDPVAVLISSIIPTVSIQAAWCVLCLPVFGNAGSTSGEKSTKGKKKAAEQTAMGTRIAVSSPSCNI